MSARRRSTLPYRGLVAPLAVIGVWLFFAAANPHFLSVSNGLNIASQFAALAIVALGEMLVIICRGFDISVGSVAALASVVGAIAVNQFGPVGLLALPLVGLGCGAVNGVLVAYCRVQPIITTLGMFSFARGLALLVGGGEQAVMLNESGDIVSFAYLSLLGIPAPLLLVLAALLAVALFLRRVRLGRRIFMVGSNPEAADLVGVPVRSTVASAYALCGLAAGLAGLLFLSRASAGLPTEGSGLELQAIASAVIGGTALTGGVGIPAAVVLGAFFVQSLLNGLNLSGISPFIASLTLGAVIVMAGLLDFVLRRASEARTLVRGGLTS